MTNPFSPFNTDPSYPPSPKPSFFARLLGFFLKPPKIHIRIGGGGFDGIENTLLAGGAFPNVRTHTHLEQHIQYTDEEGNKVYANSLDELPAHIRLEVEAVMHRATPEVSSSESHVFTMRDANGRMVTYTSLEELPPEMRALYERFESRR